MTLDLAVRLGAALAAIAAVLAGAALTARALRLGTLRWPARVRSIAILDSVALPGAASLHLVAAGGRRWLIGRSPASVVLLCELSAAGRTASTLREP